MASGGIKWASAFTRIVKREGAGTLGRRFLAERLTSTMGS